MSIAFDPTAPIVAVPAIIVGPLRTIRVELRRARLIGVVFILIGCLWVYLILFGKPSDDPVLI